MSEPNLSRRGLLGGALSMAALAAGASWSAADPAGTKRALGSVSRWNDRVQAALFSPTRLASTYSQHQIARPFPFNGFYPEALAPAIDGAAWRLELDGRIAERRPWTLADLRDLPQEAQITRLICIEGWSAVGQWSGVPLRVFLRAVGADLGARYVAFRCADGYWTSIDMASALHAQTILALDFLGRPLPIPFGFPLRLRLPTKLGFKNAKHIVSLAVTDAYVGGYWEDQGYNWFAGL